MNDPLYELYTVISVRAEGNGSCGECGQSTFIGHPPSCWAGRLLPLAEAALNQRAQPASVDAPSTPASRDEKDEERKS